MENTINERINLLARNFFGENNSKFAEKIGTSEANIRNYRKKTAPSIDILEKICDKVGISCEWLIFGRGDIFTNSNPKILTEDVKHASVSSKMILAASNEGIPLIPISAMAGFGTGDTQVLEFECERFIIPVFKEAEFLIQVKGSSMYPKYNSGDIVACRKLPVDTFFQWNKVYVLDTEQGALVKRIKKGETDDTLTIVSDNPNYDSFPLHKSKIYAIAIVVGVIREE